MMRSLGLFAVVAAIAAILVYSTSIAMAHSGPWAWTEAKAASMVGRDAAVRLPADQRAGLAQELRESVRLYRALLLATSHTADSGIQAIYQGLLNRYQAALYKVENGLEIDVASCKGTGKPVQRRFRHFRCGVTSDVLMIPTAELDYGERDLPLVIEGPSRTLGPYQADLNVHVTGRSSIAFRQMATLR